MSSALINRSLASIKTELEFLRDEGVVSVESYERIVAELPDKHTKKVVEEKQPIKATAPVEKPPLKEEKLPDFESLKIEELVEALYDYSPQQPEDLALRTGDKIVVLEHTSPDWWKGSSNGRQGMFPSNYVKPFTHSPAPISKPLQQQYSQGSSYSSSSNYNQPPAQYNYQYQYQNQNQYQQQNQQQNQLQHIPNEQLQQQQPQTVVVQQEGQHHSGHENVKKFGSKLGNAAIFGAGATIGSNIVNSIF